MSWVINSLYSSINFFLKPFVSKQQKIDYSYHARHYCNSVLPQITEFPELHEVHSLQYCEMMSAFLGFLLQLFGIFFKKEITLF